MKKTAVVLIVIAILGILGSVAKGHDTTQGHSVSVPTSTAGSEQSMQATSYKDGTYNGNNEQTPYGPVQIAVVVSGGKISDVNFLQMPNDLDHTREVTSFSEPILKKATLNSQNSHVDFISGATTTSEAYQMSLQSALNQAMMS
ncbi:MAG TPA: FMN-binding protein [Candidatus Saccharimonadales bacterium]|nr:FMN-binding protein [Candidatus Saccharimonadales bacterium]